MFLQILTNFVLFSLYYLNNLDMKKVTLILEGAQKEKYPFPLLLVLFLLFMCLKHYNNTNIAIEKRVASKLINKVEKVIIFINY